MTISHGTDTDIVGYEYPYCICEAIFKTHVDKYD